MVNKQAVISTCQSSANGCKKGASLEEQNPDK